MKHLVCFGASSEIAAAYLKTRAAEDGWRFTLVGRSAARLQAVGQTLAGAEYTTAVEDFADVDFLAHLPALLANIQVGTEVEVLVAFALLENQTSPGANQDAIARQFTVNLTHSALLCEALVALLAPIGGRLVVIGSTAADRARPTNYAYGATKAGLDYFLDGLSYRASRLGVVITQIKPGLTNSAMTRAAGRPTTLMVEPEVVARDMVRAIDRGRRVAYTPWFWFPIMAVTRLLPRWVLAKVPV